MPFRLTIRSFGLALAAGALIAGEACSPPPPKAAPRLPAAGGYPFTTASFTSVVRLDIGRSVSSRYWISPAGLLAEVTEGGKISFLLFRGTTVYEWDAGAKEGRKGPPSNGPRMTGTPDMIQILRFLPEIFQPGRFRFEKFETIDGVKAEKYAFRYKEPKRKGERAVWDADVWLLPDRAFPVRYLNRGYGGGYEILNSKVLIDPKLPEGLFEPPSDVRFKAVHLSAH